MFPSSTTWSRSLLFVTCWFLVEAMAATGATTNGTEPSPITIHDDGRIAVRVGKSREVMNGVQPFLYTAGDGVLLVQAQLSLKPYGKRRRITHFPWRVGNRLSRDFGAHWEDVIIRPGEDHPFLEGGVRAASLL